MILLIILFIIIVIAGISIYKNWNTISAIYYFATDKGEELEQKKLDTDEKALNAIKDYGIENVRPLNEEETKKLNSGELTEEEAIKIVLGQKDESTDTENTAQSETSKDGKNTTVPGTSNGLTSEELKQKNTEIAELIGKMYVLKAKFTNELAAVEDWVGSEYRKLTEEEKQSTSVKMKIGKEAYAKALALEESCDTQVADIIERLKVLLEETGQNTSLVTEIQAAYDNEKMVAKSFYMSKI